MSSLATSALLLGSISGPILGATYEISGNGTDSDNYIDVELEREVEVEQKNEADVSNDVKIYANTGGNEAEDNTGGDVEIDTGDAEVGVLIQNELNSNFASVDTCGGCVFDGEFKIAGNGSHTDNDIDFEMESEIEIDQENEADVENDVDVTANTGGNEAEDNTGGSVEIKTGDAVVNPVMILNTLNANFASVSGSDDNGSLSAWILGNGTHSDNYLDLEFENEVEIDQENEAEVGNDVAVEANTGDNDAEDNTGGPIGIDTGNVEVGVLIDNMGNFNFADVESCCLLDLAVKIADNGSDTDNDIKLELEDELEVEQENEFECGGHRHHGKGGDCNDVDITAQTGDNEVEDSTAGGEDPSIDTGDAEVAVEVSNSANVNHFGEGDFDLPGGGNSVDINIDFGGLTELLEDLLALLS